jgi:hypothetical protein
MVTLTKLQLIKDSRLAIPLTFFIKTKNDPYAIKYYFSLLILKILL